MTIINPLIVGELNPYGGDDEMALYPAPDGCSGHRLCCLILGMRRSHYLAAFDRANLCTGKWSMKAAKVKAHDIAATSGQNLILLGSKVSKAFGYWPFEPFTRPDVSVLVLPHPSGLCRIWNEPDAVGRARHAVSVFAPGVAAMIGKAVTAS